MNHNHDMRDATPVRFQEMRAKFVLKDGTQGEMLIKNVTTRGMGCEHGSAPILPGEEIDILLPFMGTRTGTVRWTRDGTCGIAMARPLDFDVLRLCSTMHADAMPGSPAPAAIADIPAEPHRPAAQS
jgi:hypothetical protein